MKTKKMFSTFAAVVVMCCILLTNVAFAADLTPSVTPGGKFDKIGFNKISKDLSTMNLNAPYSDEITYTDENGNPVTITIEYEPLMSTYSSSTYTASVGTWTISSNFNLAGITIGSLSYQFDVGKSGTQWTISNWRNFTQSAPFTKWSNPTVNILRSVSTASLPAEIDGSVKCDVFDNQWVAPLYSTTCLLYATISSGGTLTVNTN